MRIDRFRGLLRAGFEQRQRSEPRHCSAQHGSLSGAQCVSLAGTQPAWGVGAHESICVLRRTCGIRHTTDTLHHPPLLPRLAPSSHGHKVRGISTNATCPAVTWVGGSYGAVHGGGSTFVSSTMCAGLVISWATDCFCNHSHRDGDHPTKPPWVRALAHTYT